MAWMLEVQFSVDVRTLAPVVSLSAPHVKLMAVRLASDSRITIWLLDPAFARSGCLGLHHSSVSVTC